MGVILEVAKRRLEKYKDKVEFICASAENYKIEDLVDCIYISGAMHHFQSPIEAIKNCRDALDREGILIICEPVITNPYAWPRVILRPEEYGQFKVTPHNVHKWLKSNKFTVLETKYLHYRSNSPFFRFIMGLEKYSCLNWCAVMFVVVAKKEFGNMPQ